MKERSADLDNSVVGKRIDRASSVAYYENGITQSFFSCSKCDYDTIFAQKNGIVLLEIELAPNVPFLDYEKILKRAECKYWEEREMLLPPFLSIEIKEMPLTISETRRVKDLNKKPPLGKYQLKTLGFSDYRRNILDSEKTLWQQITDEKEFSAHLLENMNKKDNAQDYRAYIDWKEKLHKYLKIQLSNIWYEGDEC